MDRLLDYSVLETFKNSITKLVKNFQTNAQTVQILRAEYAIIACANAVNLFGMEGLKRDMQDWLYQNIAIIG